MHDFPVCLFNPAFRGCQNPINGLCVPAGASESSLDLVGDEEDVVSGADLSYSGQISVVGHNHSRLALDWLHHERTDATIASRLLTTNHQFQYLLTCQHRRVCTTYYTSAGSTQGPKGHSYCTPTFKRDKGPSFELKLCSKAWAAGALPWTQLGELTALPGPPSSIMGPTSKGWRGGVAQW